MNKISIPELYEIYLKHGNLVKDTRQITIGCIYLAFKGERFDGNQFATEAINNGASYALIDDPNQKHDERYLLVDDVLESIQQLAKYHRELLKCPIIGITGSNGKTTSKELINSVLSQHYKTFATAGNYNNHIGVPLSVLSISNEHEMAIIEMGANHQGEIDFLCQIAQPNFGLITNIGKAHLEGFGGIEGVKKGKSELYKFLALKKGTIFLNEDDETLLSLCPNDIPRITYGIGKKAILKGELKQEQPHLIGTWKGKNSEGEFESNLFGNYNFYNILAAICVGEHFDLSNKEIAKGISTYSSNNNRSELMKYQGASIYLDAYNANPSSVSASLAYFSNNQLGAKMVLLGDMFELGETAIEEHKKIVLLAKRLQFNKLVFVGSLYYELKDQFPEELFFESREEAKTWFDKIEKDNLQILIKGSRGMAMEKLIQ